MIENILLVFDSFDPVGQYKLSLAEEARKIVDINALVFINSGQKTSDFVFKTEERVALLGSSLPNTLSPKYLIDGDSFNDEKSSILQRIQRLKKKYKSSVLYFLLDSREFKILEESSELNLIFSIAKPIIYVFPDDVDILSREIMTRHHPLIIGHTGELNELSRASIFNVSRESFNDLVISYMNKSDECAIKRIKPHLSPERFKHCLRVAGTIKEICNILELEDSDLRYDAYLAAIYHDICKEVPQKEQIKIAEEELGIVEYPSHKVLHGPIGSWYMKKYYLFDNEEILEAVSQHTIPSEEPKFITILLYLADRLEIAKKNRYPEDLYDEVWNYIYEKSPISAFNRLINYFLEIRSKSQNTI